jgi:hypothetical protein
MRQRLGFKPDVIKSRRSGLLPSSALESAILITRLPGPMTAVVRGKNNAVGAALVEVYDIP